MNKEEALALLKGDRSQLEKWNLHRAEGGAVPDLKRADLSKHSFAFLYANSTDGFVADFSKMSLEGVKFDDSTLTAVRFDKSILDSADFFNAELEAARFVGASLVNANLSAANLTGANFRRADLTGAILDHAKFKKVRNMRLSGNDLSKVRFPPDVDEAWHILRRSYTGSALVFHALLMVVFFGLLAFRAASWIGIGAAQEATDRTMQQIEENLRKDIVVSRQVRNVDVTVEIDPSRLADAMRDARAKMFPADARVPIWKVLLELDKGWSAALLAVALLLYNLLRVLLTKFVGAMREEADASLIAPFWTAPVPRPYAPVMRWICAIPGMTDLRALIIGHRKGYALYWRLHQLAKLLTWVAIASFLWHLYGWMNESVWMTAL